MFHLNFIHIELKMPILVKIAEKNTLLNTLLNAPSKKNPIETRNRTAKKNLCSKNAKLSQMANEIVVWMKSKKKTM